MTFDPFNDFATRGYLRNKAGLRDPQAIKEVEHQSFTDSLDDALAYLKSRKQLSYADVLHVHKLLFEDVYPWAGQDRAATAPDIAVSKGSVLFAHPNDARTAVDYALRLGLDKATMRTRPGEVMGYLAYAHPFLDGNGRTIMTVHAELAQRAGISIDWGATDKVAYLTALTAEIERPGQGHLDAYLQPFIRSPVGRPNLARNITDTAGLDGRPAPDQPSAVIGSFSDPAIQSRYQLQQSRRQQSGTPVPDEPEPTRPAPRKKRTRKKSPDA
jgi:cell filamentation protein